MLYFYLKYNVKVNLNDICLALSNFLIACSEFLCSIKKTEAGHSSGPVFFTPSEVVYTYSM